MDFQGKRIVGLLRQSSDQQASLDEQEAQFKAFVKEHNLTIIAQWRVIGSAMEDDPEQFYKDMRSNGVTAYDDLRDLWSSKGFDILWALEPTRIGRAKWLYNNIIERTASSGASIYLHNGGVIDAQNVDAMVAITSIGSKADVHRMHDERAQKTYKDKADRGIPPRGVPLWTHQVIRNKSGEPVSLEIKSEAQLAIDHATILFLDGASYGDIANAMTTRGIIKLSRKYGVRRTFTNPLAHGNITHMNARNYGMWAFEQGHIIPDGIHVSYNVCPSLWVGNKHTRVKHELKRRMTEHRGRYNRRISRNPFAGLFICGLCGYAMVHETSNTKRSQQYIACRSHKNYKTNCNNKPWVKIEFLRDWLDIQIRFALDEGVLTLTPPNAIERDTWKSDINRYETEAIEIKRVLGQLILDRATDPDLTAIYTQQINEKKSQLDLIGSQLAHLKNQQPADPVAQSQTIEVIRKLTVDKLWTLPPGDINGILHQLIGQARIYMVGYDIVDIR